MSETAWPADEIVRRDVSQLVPNARNARQHGPAQIAEIAGLIREFGWTVPVLIDEHDKIIAGHGRVLAAQSLGVATIPAVVARGWSDARKRAYMIADNEVPTHSTWNKELLRVELIDLQQQGVDLKTIGFDPIDLAQQEGVEELPQALQLAPARQYAVIMCASDDEWERLKVALRLTPVRRGGYKKGSPFDGVGTQRVVTAAMLLDLLGG